MLSASQRSHLVQVLNKSREELKERYNKIDLADTNSNSETVPLCQIILNMALLERHYLTLEKEEEKAAAKNSAASDDQAINL